MLTITNADVCELNAAFNRISKVKLTSKLTWDMARNARLVKGAFSDVEEARSQLVKQHDKNGDDSISATDLEWKDFILALQAVLNTKIDLALRPMVFTEATLEELEKALTLPPTVLAKGADKAAVAAAAQADAANSSTSMGMKGAFSLLIGEQP